MPELNHRIHPRSLTDQRAEILVEGNRIGCVVRDRSDGGARLVFRRAVALPPTFTLQEKLIVQVVELIWFDGVQAGVRFAPENGRGGRPNPG